jgi:uncharacterized protein YdeI (YjbR/CyaY-like superfamily)
MRAFHGAGGALSGLLSTDDGTTVLPKLAAMSQSDQVDILTPGQWRSWLKRHHERDGGVWVVFFKSSSGRAKVDYEDLVCEAVCWGWIDSKVGRVDEERSRIWFAPRRLRSAWSDSNIQRVERLTAEGRMQPAGERAVRRAQEAGLWNGPSASGVD